MDISILHPFSRLSRQSQKFCLFRGGSCAPYAHRATPVTAPCPAGAGYRRVPRPKRARPRRRSAPACRAKGSIQVSFRSLLFLHCTGQIRPNCVRTPSHARHQTAKAKKATPPASASRVPSWGRRCTAKCSGWAGSIHSTRRAFGGKFRAAYRPEKPWKVASS